MPKLKEIHPNDKKLITLDATGKKQYICGCMEQCKQPGKTVSRTTFDKHEPSRRREESSGVLGIIQPQQATFKRTRPADLEADTNEAGANKRQRVAETAETTETALGYRDGGMSDFGEQVCIAASLLDRLMDQLF